MPILFPYNMPNLSIIIAFHPSRLENLLQTLRFLQKREPLEHYELILVCQESLPKTPFPNAQLLNLNLPGYNRPKMCNAGVEVAKSQNILLLDSDRILPPHYLEKRTEQNLSRKIISCRYLFQFTEPYTDEEIEAGRRLSCTSQLRSTTRSAVPSKNVFSGNTLMTKKDYLALGGMDEQFEGYGFNDTDISRRAQDSGLEIILEESTEFHLYHESVYWRDGEACESWDSCAYNRFLFCCKHGLRYL